MTSIITNLSVFQSLANELIKPLQLPYSQDCISFYVNEDHFTIETIPQIRNKYNHLLKCTLVKHKIVDDLHSNFNRSNISPQEPWKYNSKCIIFLHGLGSNRLEAFPLTETLPKQYCLFCFDFSGNGKSGGQTVTYGMRQSEDIQTVIQYLSQHRGFKEFIIWGRSMGAVAALLYGLTLSKKAQTSNNYSKQLQQIKSIIFDSPFSNFQQISKYIACQRVIIPHFLVDVALKCVKEHFQKVLYDPERRKNLSPFQIDFNCDFDLNLPSIFIYSLTDDVVPKQHSEKIISHCKSQYEKIIMDDFAHNETRPNHITERVYQALKKFQRREIFHKKKHSSSLLRQNSLNVSLYDSRKSRGISVYTPSKDKEKINKNQDAETTEFYSIYRTMKIQSQKKTENLVKTPTKNRRKLKEKNKKNIDQFSMASFDQSQVLKNRLNNRKDNDYQYGFRRRNNFLSNLQKKGDLEIMLNHTKYL